MPPLSHSLDISDRWIAQLRKGSLEMAVMACLWRGSRYGLEILRTLSSANGLALTEGTLYPLLSRLKSDGLLQATWVESEAGHPRKYYVLTAVGRDRLRNMAVAWASYAESIDGLLGPILQPDLEKVS